jgi:hypothetical protein
MKNARFTLYALVVGLACFLAGVGYLTTHADQAEAVTCCTEGATCCAEGAACCGQDACCSHDACCADGKCGQPCCEGGQCTKPTACCSEGTSSAKSATAEDADVCCASKEAKGAATEAKRSCPMSLAGK